MGLFGGSSKSTSIATHGDTGAADYATSYGGIDSPAVIGNGGSGTTVGAGKDSEIFTTVVDPGAFSIVVGEGAEVEGLTIQAPPRLGDDILAEIRQRQAPVTGSVPAGLIAGALPALIIAGAAFFLFKR